MKIKVETEQKYYCNNSKELIKKLRELKFKELKVKNESDEYFTDIDSEYIKNRTCLRIRKTNDSEMEITFKGKSAALLGQYCKLENNIKTTIDEYDNFISLFTSLGFYSYVIVEKERYTFEKTKGKYKYSVMIDNLPNIGGFVEFEIISNQENSIEDELKEELNNFVSNCDYLKLKEETRAYRDVVADYIYTKRSNHEYIYINLDKFLSKYQKGLVFDNKELLVTMKLLSKVSGKKYFITKLSKEFITEFFNKLDLKFNNIIYEKEKTDLQVIKSNHNNLDNVLLLKEKTLKDLNSLLLIIINNE